MRARRALLSAAVVLAALLMIIPGSGSPSGGAAHRVVAPAGPGPTLVAEPSTVRAAPSGVPARAPMAFANATLSPDLEHLPAAGGTPISALAVTAPIVRPATIPVVMTFLTNSTNCCVSANFSAPVGGPWALVVLNYTGQVVGGVYDSSYRAYIDQAQVLFGTTPEYGIWYVERDVTPYESLLNGTFNFTFLLAAALVGGHFLNSVSLSFYPASAGAPAPREPDTVIPLFHRVFVATTSPTLYDDALVPNDVVNATLEIWTYGFGPDEFWYATPQPYRNLYLAANGSPIVSVLPFPYINTGGEDLFTWRPITAVFTASDRPYEFDVTGALGLLEGYRNFSVNVSGVTPNSNWLVGASLLLYTNATAGPASLVSYRFSAPPARSSTGGGTTTVTDAPTYSYASQIPWAGRSENVTLFANSSFQSTMVTGASGGWNNLTSLETTVSHEVIALGGSVESVDRSVSYPVAMDLGQTLVITSTTGGGYPEYGNFTTYFLNGVQEWSESTVRTLESTSPPTVESSSFVDDRFTGGSNVYSGREELTGPNAALLLAITFITSATSIAYADTESGGPLTVRYQHQLSGASYQPPGPYNAETVLVNSVSDPPAAGLQALPGVLELGESVTIVPVAGGGVPPYRLTYSGLPPGCSAPGAGPWICVPTAAGSYSVNLAVQDATGATVAAIPVSITVYTAPELSLATNRSAYDVGGTVYLAASLGGGVAPFSCRWTVNGTAPAIQPCPAGFSFAPAGAATYNVTVVATDARNVSAGPRWIHLVVNPMPQLALSPGSDGNGTVGRALVFSASLAGGSGNASYVWLVNDTAVSGVTGATFVLVPTGAASYVVSVEATDSAGGTAFAGPVTWTFRSAPPGAGPSGTSGSTDLTTALAFLGLGALVGAAVPILVIRAGRLRHRLGPPKG